MLTNKNANILAFDEVIGKNTSFEGNDATKSISETTEIIKYLISQNCSTKKIDDKILSNLLKIVSDTKSEIDLSKIKTNNNNYYLVGWTGHAILLFYEKEEDSDLYRIGIINAGQGVDIQGCSADLGNCIIIFNGIEYEKLYAFFEAYKTYIKNDEEKKNKNDYYPFYSLLLNKLVDNKNYNVDFSQLIELKKIECLQMNMQHIGSCTFTNHINYLCYLIYKDGLTTNYNKIYLEWYAKAKNIMKKKLYDEIISEKQYKKKYYFTYKYILDTIEDHSLKPNKDYESLIKNIDFNDIEYNHQDIPTVSISRKNIYDGEYKDIFWKLYENEDVEFIDFITLNKDDEKIKHILDALFEFFKKTKRIDNNIYYFIPLLELYKLYKKGILINDKILIDLYRKYLSLEYTCKADDADRNYIIEIQILYTLIICILLGNKRNKYYYIDRITPDNLDLNKKIYMHFLSHIPIVNGKYFNSISELIGEIIASIDLFPNVKVSPAGENETDVFRFYNTKQNMDEKNRIQLDFGMGDEYNFGNLLRKYKLITGQEHGETELNWEMKERGKIDIHIAILVSKQDFLLDSILLENTECNNTKNNKYETYNFIINKREEDYKSEKIFKSKSNDFRLEDKKFGKCFPRENKITIFKNKIRDSLLKPIGNCSSYTNLKNYILYFYLCELDGNKIDDPICNLYHKHIEGYFIDHYYKMKELICTYILKYHGDLQVEYKILDIRHNTLIPKSEKQHFIKNNTYKYLLKDGYCTSVIDFFIINYNTITDTNIVLYKDDKNTIESVKIIKKLFEKNYNIYLGLNFYFKYEVADSKPTKIIGIDKNNKFITIRGDYNAETKNITNLIYIKGDLKYDILTSNQIKSDNNISDNIKNFYNIMALNDNILLFYKSKKSKSEDIQSYYIKLHNYDLLFEAVDKKIYYNLNSIKYEVLFNYDEDTYNNFGIFKLLNTSEQTDKKLLCIYNYNNILEQNYNDYSFINFEEESYNGFNEINDKYIKYYYTIINTFNDKIIIKNDDDALSILINCLYYNSPLLLLKTVIQIVQIIKNYKIDKKLIDTLFKFSKNAYSLFLYDLIYQSNLNNYNYNYFNKLMDKYNYNIKTDINSLYNTFSYLILEHELEPNSESSQKELIYNYYLKLEQITRPIYFYITNKEGILSYKLHDGKQTKYPILKIKYKHFPQVLYVEKHKIINYHKYIRPDYNLFPKLLKVNIREINEENLKANIEKAEKFFNYLINNDKKKELFPVQELIMGSGKSSVITPYLCLLLTNYFIFYRTHIYKPHIPKPPIPEIYIVMPEMLIFQSYETLMKNLFVLNFDIEILLYTGSYPINGLYSDSIKIILISDTNYKEIFLTNKIDTTNKYMIYDEVDIMANPLTCELNMPINDKTELSNIDLIFNLTKNIYNEMFINDQFWTKIKLISLNVNDNKIHQYIFLNINQDQKKYINKCFDHIIASLNLGTDKTPLIEYFKSNILNYILTKQFNYEYGLPDVYPDNTTSNYMYRAIPYSGGDAPLYGSDFSDPILIYVLTYFCYYLNLKRNKLRKMDKRDIIKIYEDKYKEKDYVNEPTFLQEFNRFFNLDISNMTKYLNNSIFYSNKLNDVFDVEPSIFEKYIKQILDRNRNYYNKCKNISFNDLLLHKNVKNIISFTGTAYIELPTEQNISYKGDEQIEYGLINKSKIEEVIKSIILNNKKTKLYGINKSENLTDDIFSCITQYDVLIDIGAVFINYTNEAFKLRYTKIEGKKKYLVYFENSIKIYNTLTNTYESKSAIKIGKKDTFFYFSNKNITGVDAKDIMNKQAKGLVTINNKTILRDFSQGIFRMRNILDGDQSIDIVINKIMNGGDDNRTIMRGGGTDTGKCEIQYMSYEDINRRNLFNVLKLNQELLDKEKRSLLLKQNIIGLLKNDTIIGEHYLYNDPSKEHEDYSTKIEKIIKKKIQSNDITNYQFLKDVEEDVVDVTGTRLLRDLTSLKVLIDTKFDINNINDQNIIHFMSEYLKNLDKYLIDKINEYFKQKKGQNMQINRLTNVEEEQQKKIDKDTKTELQINISTLLKQANKRNDYNVMSNLDISEIKNMRNKDEETPIVIENLIIFCNSCYKYPLFILYNKSDNNIYVFNNITFNYYLLYNKINDDIYDKYIFISLINDISFGKDLDLDPDIKVKIQMIKILIKKFIQRLSEDSLTVHSKSYTISSKEMSFYENNEELFKIFRDSFTKCYNNSIRGFKDDGTSYYGIVSADGTVYGGGSYGVGSYGGGSYGGSYGNIDNVDNDYDYYNKYLKYKSKYLALKKFIN
jgi:hypothetical protein